MALNFSDALAETKRKAALQGRPISQQEVAGMAEGTAANATSRLATIKTLELRKQELDEDKRRYDDEVRRNLRDKEDVERTERGSKIGSIVGAGVGFIAGGGPAGASLGASVGGTMGGCIIISACTDRKSYEVEISRQFRDKYMSECCLGGYYAIANIVAPLIRKSNFIKLIAKRFLVDRLVDYAEWLFEIKPKRQLRTSRIITEGFLSFCAVVGMHTDIRPLINAHGE